ncbi:MAG: hypothetical protein ABJA11_03075 [Pseudolysinimonas sp.]
MAASMRHRHVARFAAVLMAVVASCATLVLAMPSSARAATQVVQFSTDGMHWSDSYAGQLFTDIQLVPLTSFTRTFYVRNGANQPALLQITLADVTTNNLDLANGLSISSSTPGIPGTPVPVTSAQPCHTLSSGLRLASGDSVRVDNTAALGNLGGTVGQGGAVSFVLRVSLSSTDAAAPLPNACPGNYGTINTFDSPTSTTVYHRTTQGWTPSTSVGGGKTTIQTTPIAPGAQPSTQLADALVTNTARLYQEYDVAFWLAMSALGAFILFLVRRRRAEDQPELDNHEQIGTRR